MLVTFHSSTSGEIMMFAESARVILGILAKDCTARGVITLDELPAAIAALRGAMQQRRGQPAEARPASGKDDAGEERQELPVGFVQRATPFVELLERTLADEGYVMWQAAADFGAG
jgi:hypothetical protein